ncbi:MAG: hypothetical protein ACRC0J_12180 [Shewanella oncorhynchi]
MTNSRIKHTTSGYTLVQWASWLDHFTCVELDGVDLPIKGCDVVFLREGKFYNFSDGSLCEWVGEILPTKVGYTIIDTICGEPATDFEFDTEQAALSVVLCLNETLGWNHLEVVEVAA